MPAANSHSMKVQVGYEADASGLQSLVEMTEKLNQSSKQAAEAMKQIETAAKNVGGKTSKTSSANSQWLTQQKQMYQAGLKSYDQYVSEVKQKEQKLYSDLRNIRQKQGEGSDEFKKKLSEYQSYAKAVQQIEKQNTQVINNEIKSQTSFLTKQTNQSLSNYRKLGAEISKIANSSKSAFGSNIFNSMLSYGAISQVTSAFQDLGRAIVDIQYNTVNNQRLMGDWSTDLRDQLNSSAAEIAKSTGIQITDAQQIQGAWIRINDQYANSADLLGEISDLTAKFMNVGEIEDAESAVALLNASLLQMKDSTQDTAAAAEEFLNKWAYMADKTAMGTADEYGEAISRYGAQLKTLGGDMDDAIAQSSVLADRLAMNGNEAGTALKTFNTYLSRDKTLELFDEIAESTGDMSYKLYDANGQLKDYRDLLGTIAKAYQKFSSEGNDIMANKVLDAIGATRRRDVAKAMMDAVNSGDYDEYVAMSEGTDANYLEEQNAALMNTLKNQWNAMVVSMQQAAMQLGNAGILDGITLLINGAQQAFDAFSALPQPIQQFVSTLLMVKTATAGLSKLGEITGFTEKFGSAFKYGSEASRDYANEITKITQNFADISSKSLQSVSAIDSTTNAYKTAKAETDAYGKKLEQLGIAYKEGRINADQYAERTQELTSTYQANITEVGNLAAKYKETAQARLEEAQGAMQQKEMNLQVAQTALQEATTSDQQQIALQMVEQAKKECVTASAELRSAEKNLANAQREVAAAAKIEANGLTNSASLSDKMVNVNKKQASSSKSLLTTLKQKAAVLAGVKGAETMAAASTQTFTVAQIASAAASKVASGALTVLKTALGMVFNPLTLITVGITLLSTLFGNSKSKVEEYGETLDGLKTELDEVNSKIQELNDLESQNGGLTEAQQSQLSALEAKKSMLEEQIALTETLKANEEFLNHQGGFLGIGGEDSGLEKAQDALRTWQEAASAFDQAKHNFDFVDEKVKAGEKMYEANLEQASKDLVEASDAQLNAANELVTQYNELKRLTEKTDRNGDGVANESILDGDAYDEAINQMNAMESEYQKAASVIQDWANEHGVSFEQASAAIEEYQTQLESTTSAISELKSASEALKGALDIQNQKGVLTLEQTYDLLSKMGDQAPLLAGALEKTENGYKLNAQAQEVLNQLTQDGNTNMEDAIDLLLKGSEGAVADANAKEQQANATNKVSESVKNQKEATEKLTEAQQKLKDAMTGAGMEVNFERDIKPLTFSLNFEGENAKAQAEQTVADIRAKIDEINNSDIDPNVKAAKVDYLTQQLGQAILKKQELSQPSFMSIDVSQATGNMATLVSQLQDYQRLKDEIEYNQAIGVDTTQAESDLAGLASQIQTTLAQDETLDIGVTPNTDNFQAELDAAIGEGKVEIDADLVINDEGGAKVVEDIKNTVNSLPDDKTVDIQINTLGKRELSDLQGKLDNLTTTKDVTVKISITNQDSLSALISSINNLPSVKEGKVVYGVSTGNVTMYTPPDKDATVKYDVDSSAPDGYEPDDESATVTYSVNSWAVDRWSPPPKYGTLTYDIKLRGGDFVNGTAHVNGTVTGNAYAQGNWGAKQTSTSLVGELGQELVVRGSRWFTVGDEGAEFAKIRKGDIVFNHLQTKELLENGYVTSGGGRGRALVTGTVKGNAFANGTAYADGTRTPYEPKYEITDDKIIAGTIAVQREAKKAAEAAQRAANASEDAAEELEKAADKAAEAAKEVESLTDKYINNVEDLQGRIADSLKEHYEMEFDERKKILEQEHNARIDSLQKEIDMINGETIEDKESELASLQEQLAKWSLDDSTLGKKKQKELQDAIDDLTKEIKIDKLEQQMDEENERYDQSIDEDSENFDSVLKDLTDKMTDKNLYTTANELIKNGDMDTINKLLSEHDAQWDGWQTLMGKTAEQIIQEEVLNAINNYKDVTQGTIYESGGHYTDGVAIPSPTPTPPASSAPNIGVGSRINAGSAPIYAGKGGAGYRQYFASDPVYNVVQVDGDWLLVRWHGLSSGLTGWFKKSDVTAFDTGGYTANNEGMAMLHAKERVLNAQQTAAFENLVYDFLPRISKNLVSPSMSESTVINNNGHTFNKELVSVHVDQVVNNTQRDIDNSEDNLDRLFRTSLKRAGINLKR